MNILSQLNSAVMYLICGVIVLFVALICVVFAIRAYRIGKTIGMDEVKMKRTIISSATFAVLPSIGILLGVIALSGSLGTPWPWLRLSVIGALHYETQVAEAAAESVGLSALSASQMTAEAFTTIALLMSTCIIWGMLFCTLTCKSYTKKLSGSSMSSKTDSSNKPTSTDSDIEKTEFNPNRSKKKKFSIADFGDTAMTAMFIGLVSAYIGSYIGGFVSGNGVLSFDGSWLPLSVAAIGAAAMAIFTFIKEKFKAPWIDSFSIAGSMLIAMTSAIFLGKMI